VGVNGDYQTTTCRTFGQEITGQGDIVV
jgi:hypothetical protein